MIDSAPKILELIPDIARRSNSQVGSSQNLESDPLMEATTDLIGSSQEIEEQSTQDNLLNFDSLIMSQIDQRTDPLLKYTQDIDVEAILQNQGSLCDAEYKPYEWVPSPSLQKSKLLRLLKNKS